MLLTCVNKWNIIVKCYHFNNTIINNWFVENVCCILGKSEKCEEKNTITALIFTWFLIKTGIFCFMLKDFSIALFAVHITSAQQFQRLSSFSSTIEADIFWHNNIQIIIAFKTVCADTQNKFCSRFILQKITQDSWKCTSKQILYFKRCVCVCVNVWHQTCILESLKSIKQLLLMGVNLWNNKCAQKDLGVNTSIVFTRLFKGYCKMVKMHSQQIDNSLILCEGKFSNQLLLI